jgi:hypothetical protein
VGLEPLARGESIVLPELRPLNRHLLTEARPSFASCA